MGSQVLKPTCEVVKNVASKGGAHFSEAGHTPKSCHRPPRRVRTRGLQGPLSVFSLPLECGREERRRGAREARTHLHGTLLQMHPQRMRRHCELALAKCPRTLANAPAAHTQRTALVTCRSPTRRTRGGHEEDTRRTRGGHEEDTRRARGGHEEDTRRTRGGHEEGTRRTRGGHEEDTRRTQGGHEEDTRRTPR